MSVNADNDVWVSGTGSRSLRSDRRETPARSSAPRARSATAGTAASSIPTGSSGRLGPMLRWDTAGPLSGPNGGTWTGWSDDSYGLCIDPLGNVWNTMLSAGTPSRSTPPTARSSAAFSHGTYYAQGCAADRERRHLGGQLVLYDHYVVGTSRTTGPSSATSNWSQGRARPASRSMPPASCGSPTTTRHGVARSIPTPARSALTVRPRRVRSSSPPPYLGGLLYNYSDMTGSTLTGIAPERNMDGDLRQRRGRQHLGSGRLGRDHAV